MNGSNNEVMVVSADNHQLGSSLTWAYNMSHMIGSYVGSKFSIRNRIGMSTAFTPMITVSGYANTFANIYMFARQSFYNPVYWFYRTGFDAYPLSSFYLTF